MLASNAVAAIVSVARVLASPAIPVLAFLPACLLACELTSIGFLAASLVPAWSLLVLLESLVPSSSLSDGCGFVFSSAGVLLSSSDGFLSSSDGLLSSSDGLLSSSDGLLSSSDGLLSSSDGLLSSSDGFLSSSDGLLSSPGLISSPGFEGFPTTKSSDSIVSVDSSG